MATTSSAPLLPDELLQRTISLAFLTSASTTSPSAASLFTPRGLVNVSNRCYLSSVLQCLLATRPFAAYLHQCIDSAPLASLRPCLASVSDAAPTYAELLGFVAEYGQAEQAGAVRVNASLKASSSALPRVASPAPSTNGATPSQPQPAQQTTAPSASTSSSSNTSSTSTSFSSAPAIVAPRPVAASTSSSSLSDLRSDHSGSPPPAAGDDEWSVSDTKAAKRAKHKATKLTQPPQHTLPRRTPSPQPTPHTATAHAKQQNGHSPAAPMAASAEADPVEEVAAYIAATQLNGHGGADVERDVQEEAEDVAAGMQGGSTSANRRRRRKKAQQAAAAGVLSQTNHSAAAPAVKVMPSTAPTTQSSPHSLLSHASAALNAAPQSAPAVQAAPTATSTAAATLLQHAATHPPFAPSFPQLLSVFQRSQVGRQEDAAEFLLFLLDRLQEESIRVQQRLSDNGVDGFGSAAAADEWTEIGKGSKQLIMRKGTTLSVTPISSLFSFRLRSCLHIPMRHKDSISFQPAYLLPLDLPAPPTPPTTAQPPTPRTHPPPFRIEDAISRFMSTHALDDHRRKGASQSHSIDGGALPACLVLHVKRFDASLRKVGVHVVFGDVLLLPAAVLHGWTGGAGGGVRWRLCGVLVHHGATVASGHYTSFVRYRGADGSSGSGGEGASECWVSIDDSRVSVVSASTVFAQQAYMLFYSRI